VLHPIELDDQLPLVADEIGDRVSDRRLTPELEAIEFPASQLGPQALFGPRRIAPHVSRKSAQPRFHALAHRPLTRFA